MRISRQELQEIRELPDASEVDHLRELDLSNKYVSEVGYLSKLMELEDLNLSFNDLTSIAELGGAARLDRLLVQHNKLVSLDGVDQMLRLRALRAQKNRISDLSPLRACSQLEELWVQQNSIRDIHVFARCLGDLPQLRRLVAFPNPFCPHTEGQQYHLCRSYLLTQLRSLTYLNGDLEGHEREEADEFFRTEQGRRELQALVPVDLTKRSHSRARAAAGGPLDVTDGSSESLAERRRGHWHRTGSANSGRGSPTAAPAGVPAALVNRKGGSGSHMHQALPKDALLQWLNGMLGLHETLDTLVSTAAVCQVMDVLGRCCDRFPDCVPMHKLNFRAVMEHDCVKNYKVLQEIFRRFGVAEQPNWSTLAKGRSTDLLELLRWTHRFCEEHGVTASEWRPIDEGGRGTVHGRWEHQYMLQQRDGTKYDPVRRREKALKPPVPGMAKKPSQKFSAHVAKRSGAFSQTERAAHGLYADPDERDLGSPKQRSPVWAETRAETQARAYSGIKSSATSPRGQSSSNRVQRHSHSSPSRALRSPSTGAGRARSRSRMEDPSRAPELRSASGVAGSEAVWQEDELQLHSAQRKLRKIQQLCDNARGSSPGRENRDLEDFITSIERVLRLSDTQGVSAARTEYREQAQEAPAVSPTTRADRDEIALLRAQIEAIDAKISQRDTASPASSVTSTSNTTTAPLSPGRAAQRVRKVQISTEIHTPSSSRVIHAFEMHQGGDTDGLVSWDGAQTASEELFPGLAVHTPFLPLVLRHAFEAADRRQSESLDRESFIGFVDAVVYFYRNWDRFEFVQDELMLGGRQRSLDLDRFLDACDHVFEEQPSPPAPDATTLTDEFQMLTQGLGGLEFSDFASWAARIMCEPVDDEFDSGEDDDDDEVDPDGWRRGKSRQYGGGAAGGGVADEQPPPISSVGLAPAAHADVLNTSPVSWEYRRDESTGISYKIDPKTGESAWTSSSDEDD